MKRLSWFKIQPLPPCKPSQRWGHSSCVIQNNLVIFGGYADSNYMNDLWVFNTTTLQWKILQTYGNVPQPRSNATLNYDHQKNRLIMFGGGGIGKKRFNTIHTLDWEKKKWELIQIDNNEICPWERTYHISQILGNHLIIFGGQNFADLNDIWLFDLKQNKWRQVKFQINDIKPSPRRFHSSVIRNNQLIVIGGCHNKYRSLKDIFRMDFKQFLKTNDVASLKWQQIHLQNPDFIPRWGHSSNYNPLNDQIYIFAGRFSTDLNDIVTLDMDQKTSNKISVKGQQSPFPRRRHSANFIGSSFVIFGGFNGSYYNDLYSITIPSEINLPKFTNDQIIPFDQFLKNQHQDTVEFLQNYFKSFDQIDNNLNQKNYSAQQKNQIYTAIVKQFTASNDPTKNHQKQIQSLFNENYLRQNLRIYSSKQLKLQSIRNKYTKYRYLVLEKMPFSQKRNQENNKNTILQVPNQLVSQILFLRGQQFQKYLKDNNSIIWNRQGQKCEHNYQRMEDEKSLFINFQQIGKMIINPIVIFTNPYFQNCYKNNNQIYFNKFDHKNFRVFQVGIMYIQTSILVVPDNFSLHQWQLLAQFSLYFCVQNLKIIIQKYLITKVTFQTISSLSKLSTALKMKNLMIKCSKTIIEREQIQFFLKKSSSKQITSKLFSQFQNKFYSKLQNFIYPLNFQHQITYQFQINKLSILLKNINKIKEISNEKIKVNNMYNNDQKENEENNSTVTMY